MIGVGRWNLVIQNSNEILFFSDMKNESFEVWKSYLLENDFVEL